MSKIIAIDPGKSKCGLLLADLDKELVFHEATSLGLQFSSENFMRLHERYNQLLVNSFYENDNFVMKCQFC